MWGGARRRDLSHLQPRSSGRWGAACPQRPPGPGPPGGAGGSAGTSGPTALGGGPVTLPGPGYGVLLLWAALPPFMMADALVLLLGVTPAFGTVSPTSCRDGSRYMATGGGKGEEGRKGDVSRLGSRADLRRRPSPLFSQSQVTPSTGIPVLKK